MKKTLKRIIAAAAALPIAAYSVPAFAVEVADAPLAAQTAASAVLIDVTAEDMTAIRESQYTCEWNLLITAGLWCCTDTTCAMDVSTLYDTVIAHAGSYAAFAEQLFACVENETLTYSGGVFDISASIPSALTVLADANGTSLSDQLQNAGADVSALDMSGLDIPCTIRIKADFQNTGVSRTVGLSYGIETADSTFTLAGENSFQSYFAEKFDAFAASVNADAAVQTILDNAAAKIGAADIAADSVMNKQASVTAASLNDALTQIEASYPEYAHKIPASAETIAQVLESSWNSLFTQINANIIPEGGEINLDVHEVAAIFDSLTNVTLTLENGYAKISGVLADDQTDAVKAYYTDNAAAMATLAQNAVQAGDGDATGLSAYTDGMTLEDTAKVVEASLPLNMLESGSGELYYNVYRTYTFSAPEETEPAATETTVSEESTETTVTETTEATETSVPEETTVSETTEAVETSVFEETTVSETTEEAETSASEETATTAASSGTECTEDDDCDDNNHDCDDEDDDNHNCDKEDGHRHCGRQHRHRRHRDHGMCPDWNWKEGPKWDWNGCHDWDEFQDWEWVECPGDKECPYWEHVDKSDWNWEDCMDWEWIDFPEWNPDDCGDEERRHGGRRECFTDFKEMFGDMDSVSFEGGMPCIRLNR